MLITCTSKREAPLNEIAPQTLTLSLYLDVPGTVSGYVLLGLQ